MSSPVSYTQFCMRYALNPNEAASRSEYQDHLEGLGFVNGLFDVVQEKERGMAFFKALPAHQLRRARALVEQDAKAFPKLWKGVKCD